MRPSPTPLSTLFRVALFAAAASAFFSCETTKRGNWQGKDGKIEVLLMHINDIYEIAGLDGGRSGGMARVGYLKKELLSKNPNTLLLHGGDFLNPSVTATQEYEGKKIKGRQMVECMNAAGVDLVTFGNHEFDIKENELLDRLAESRFRWVSSNVKHKVDGKTEAFKEYDGKAVPQWKVYKMQDADGTQFRVGFIGVTLPSNPQPFVAYDDFIASAKTAYNIVKDSCDLVVALTHLEIEDDRRLAREIPGLGLILGGHDHSHMEVQEGNCIIRKADANARTAWVVKIEMDYAKPKPRITARLETLNSSVPGDPSVQAVVQKWTDISNKIFQRDGFDPTETVAVLPRPLDGREDVVRGGPCELSSLVAQSFSAATPKSQAAFLNTGSIRIDDIVTGTLTQYDVLRILPFGGKVIEVDIKGDLLSQVIQIGLTQNRDMGGYLALDRLNYDGHMCTIGGKQIDPTATYRVALSDFLLLGKEANLGFLTRDNPGIVKVYEPDAADTKDVRNDVRKAFIAYMKTAKL